MRLRHRRARGPTAWSLLLAGSCVIAASALGQEPPPRKPLERAYREGEAIGYHITCSKRTGDKPGGYAADARGTVRRDSSGSFLEDLTWSNLTTDGRPVALPSGEAAVHQRISLARAFPLSIPNLAQVPGSLVGPITDLMTFYADLRLASASDSLSRPGDHFRFSHGKANSWATPAAGLLVGEDAIDFEVTLLGMDPAARTASLVVRHVPPTAPGIRIPAGWMRAPVADAPNNWIQVLRTGPQKWLAQVGKETFDVRLTVSLVDGSIVSGTLDNLVEVEQRECQDPTLASPGRPVRYRIERRIELQRVP